MPPSNFSCSLYRRTKDLLEQQNFQVRVGSTTREEITRPTCRVTPDNLLHEVRGGDYDVIIFIAGRGNRQMMHESEAHRVAQEALAAGKVVGAEGLAVDILANAGLLKHRRAAGPLSAIPLLQEKGVSYTTAPVVADNGIVTLGEPRFFSVFGEQLLALVRRPEKLRKAA